MSAHRSILTAVLLGISSVLLLPGAASGQIGGIDLPTSEIALLGRFARGPVDLPVRVGPNEFEILFSSPNPASWPAEVQTRQFFANNGEALYVVRITEDDPLAEALVGSAAHLRGLHALEPLSDLRLLMAPELSLLPANEFGAAFERFGLFLEPRRIFLVLDPPPGLGSANAAVEWTQASVPTDAGFCALYYPYLNVLLDGVPLRIGACGAMAAIYVRNDSASGIWSSPAGTSLALPAQSLHPRLSSADYDLLNQNHINGIREFPAIGIVPWGARTLDRSNPENRYLANVRTRDWIAASIERALAFAAVEDNGPPLWAQIRLLVGDFLFALFQQGALLGTTPTEAYFVRCDATTTTATDIAQHRVNVVYGLALIRPSEFDIQRLSAPTYDPTRPAPRPAINVHTLAGDLVLAYPTVAGFSYLLEVSPDIQSSDWAPGARVVIGDAAWRRPVMPMTAESAFYRLRITPTR